MSNSKGRLTSASSSVSTTSITAYDALGRVTQSQQATAGQTYSFSYGYDLAGNLTSQTYPSGKVVVSGFDTAGRITSVTAGSTTYASSLSYSPQGAIGVMKLGNQKWEHTNFNNRLQPVEIGLGTSSTDASLLKLSYGYGTTSNNGNVLSQSIGIGATTFSQSYSYDGLNRLASASEGSAWSQTYGYDRYGNRAVTAGYVPTPTLTPSTLTAFSTSTNHITNASYDAAGNLITDQASRTFSYDGENRQLTYNGGLGVVNYYYDGDGRRVKKLEGGVTTVFVYNVFGQLAAEYSSAAASGVGGTRYLTQDHLGSTRLVTDASGTPKVRRDYLPFGEEIAASLGGRSSITGYGAIEGTRQKFTSKERDNESNLDFFGARYSSGAQGRFTGVDLGPVYLRRPQLWNRYTYALNNPLVYIDPDGKRVQVFVERINRTGLNTLSYFSPTFRIALAPRHAYAVITTKEDKIFVGELEGPSQTSKPKGNLRLKEIEKNDSPHNGRLDVVEVDVTRPSGVSPEDFRFEDKLLETFDLFQNHSEILPDYDPLGPNSNGFINFVIDLAGGRVNLPTYNYGKDDTLIYSILYFSHFNFFRWFDIYTEQQRRNQQEEEIKRLLGDLPKSVR